VACSGYTTPGIAGAPRRGSAGLVRSSSTWSMQERSSHVEPSTSAVACAKATAAAVKVDFFVDDLTRLRRLQGPYDLLVDYGTLDDLDAAGRDAYVRAVIPLAAPGARFLIWCFEWDLRRWERLVTRILPTGGLAMAPGEVSHRFGSTFEIERVAGQDGLSGWPRGWAAYLMTRRA